MEKLTVAGEFVVPTGVEDSFSPAIAFFKKALALAVPWVSADPWNNGDRVTPSQGRRAESESRLCVGC